MKPPINGIRRLSASFREPRWPDRRGVPVPSSVGPSLLNTEEMGGGDPTPDECDEPFHHVEWGIALPAGEAMQPIDEDAARAVVSDRDDVYLVRREVVHQPWTVAPRSSSPER